MQCNVWVRNNSYVSSPFHQNQILPKTSSKVFILCLGGHGLEVPRRHIRGKNGCWSSWIFGWAHRPWAMSTVHANPTLHRVVSGQTKIFKIGHRPTCRVWSGCCAKPNFPKFSMLCHARSNNVVPFHAFFKRMWLMCGLQLRAWAKPVWPAWPTTIFH